MGESGGDWCLIESDPGVFTQLIKKFGASGVQVEEIWSMDDSMFDNLRSVPVHGLIFLFKFLKNEPAAGAVVTDTHLLEKIYFCKQVINNACATQAVIGLLLNCSHPDLALGPELTELKEFSRSFDPGLRGLALSNSQTIRAAHNSMAQQHVFELPDLPHAKEEEAYHYVSYLPLEGRVIELDGLREGPLDHGPVPSGMDWLDVVRPIITARIQRYTEGEIHFNLMALVSDRKLLYERQLEQLVTSSRYRGMEDVDEEVVRLRALIEYEDGQTARHAAESARRRHNYLPFIINLLKVLGEEKRLSRLVNKCKERQRRGTKRLKT